jgi:GTPase involved in cell partitioning and DNA repair
MILGQAREKFAQIAGPGGGSSLNGAAMKSEAQAEMDKLMEDLKTGVTTQGWGWVIG